MAFKILDPKTKVHSKCTKLEWEWVKTLELMESEEQCPGCPFLRRSQ